MLLLLMCPAYLTPADAEAPPAEEVKAPTPPPPPPPAGKPTGIQTFRSPQFHPCFVPFPIVTLNGESDFTFKY